MKLTIEINMDNEAFFDGDHVNGTEAARILRKLASWMDAEQLSEQDGRQLLDINGNHCGFSRIEE